LGLLFLFQMNTTRLRLLIGIIFFALILWILNSISSALVFPVEISDYRFRASAPSAFRQAASLAYNQDYHLAARKYECLLQQGSLHKNDSLYIFNQLTYCFLRLGQENVAWQWINALEEICADPKEYETPARADYYFNKGTLCYEHCQRQEGYTFLLKAVALYREVYGSNHLRTAQALTQLALVSSELLPYSSESNRYVAEANDIYQNSEALAPYRWDCDFALAISSLYGRAHERGEQYCRDALSRLKALPNGNPVFEARCWNALGNMLKKQGDNLQSTDVKARHRLYHFAEDSCFGKAVSLLQKTSSIRLQEVLRDRIIHATRFFPDTTLFVRYLNDLALLLQSQTDYYGFPDRLRGYAESDTKRSSAYYQQFLQQYEQDKRVSTFILDEAYFVLRENYAAIDSFDRALEYAVKTLRVYNCCQAVGNCQDENFFRRIDAEKTPCMVACGSIARILLRKYQRTGDGNALKWANRYFELVDRNLFPSIVHADEDAILTYQSEVGNVLYPSALEAAYEAWRVTNQREWLDRVFRYGERVKSYLLYRDMLRQEGVNTVVWADSVRLWQGRVNRYLDFQRLHGALTDQERAGLQTAQIHLGDVLTARRQDSLEYWDQIRQPIPTLAEAQQKCVKTGQCIIQYMTGQGRIFGLYLDRNKVFLFPVDSLNTLSTDVESLFQILQATSIDQRKKFVPTARRLYQRLIEPFAANLVPDGELLVIPDRTIALLPFEVLLSPTSTGSNLELDQSLPYLIRKTAVSYAPSWKVWQANSGKRNRPLAHASVGFWADTSISHTSEIYRAIGKNHAGLVDLGIPNKGHFLSHLARYEVLHLSLHAQSDLNDRRNNRIYFGTAAGDTLYGYDMAENPCVASLVVLAACQTASGRNTTGEGCFSLSRAFLQAGAAQVVSTLWEVNTATTATLLVDFYGFLNQGYLPAEALRRAKLQYLDSPKTSLWYPFYWAGVVVS